MPKTQDTEVVTFKLDKATMQLMKGIENRSEFIRNAILGALDNMCPFCKGTGVLNVHRKKHWEQLANQHQQRVCKECDEQIFD
jgi:DnaJ-class molecular chaperone